MGIQWRTGYRLCYELPFIKTVNGCKDVSIMNSVEGQVYSVCQLQFFCFTKYNDYNRMKSKHKQTNCKQSRQKSYGLQLSQ